MTRVDVDGSVSNVQNPDGKPIDVDTSFQLGAKCQEDEQCLARAFVRAQKKAKTLGCEVGGVDGQFFLSCDGQSEEKKQESLNLVLAEVNADSSESEATAVDVPENLASKDPNNASVIAFSALNSIVLLISLFF